MLYITEEACPAIHAATSEPCCFPANHRGLHFVSQEWPEGGEWNFSNEEALGYLDAFDPEGVR